jgi:hypothetical protein
MCVCCTKVDVQCVKVKKTIAVLFASI